MSAQDLIRPASFGPVPTTFEVLRDSARPDWQTAVPTEPEQRRWYTVGYELKDDYALTDPISTLTPVESRFWWALGLADAKGDTARRATWHKEEPPPAPPSGDVPWAPLLAGAAAGTVALFVWAASSGPKE